MLDSLLSAGNVESSNDSFEPNGSCSLSDSELSESKMRSYIYIKWNRTKLYNLPFDKAICKIRDDLELVLEPVKTL